MKKLDRYSIPLLRYSYACLFLWFGYMQLTNPGMWVAYLPEFTGYFPIPGEMLVMLNGWFEVIAGVMLVVGIYTRYISLILGLHLFGIAVTAGGAIGVRDFVLGMMGMGLFLSDEDALTFDKKSL